MKRILFVDSSVELQQEAKKLLGLNYSVTQALNLLEAKASVAKDLFDLIVLKDFYPLEDSIGFCRQLKAHDLTADVPIFLLSDRYQLENKIEAFQTGVDDYLVKPIEILELKARVDVRFKRTKDLSDKESFLIKGDLTLSIPFQKALLKVGGEDKDLRLTPTEFRLLYFFVKNEGQVLTRSQLLATIWSDDVHVLKRTIDKHISTLKKKLSVRAYYIQSIHSKGYLFTVLKQSQRSKSAIENMDAAVTI